MDSTGEPRRLNRSFDRGIAAPDFETGHLVNGICAWTDGKISTSDRVCAVAVHESFFRAAAFFLRCVQSAFSVCGPQGFRGRPQGRSQENQVLNEELTGAAKYFNTVAKLDRARRRKQEARREQERDDGPQAPHERCPRR